MLKVTKFGGSSLASAEQMAKVGEIIRSDPDRKFIIPSAPGKRYSDDTKVTDMLYKCYDDVCAGANAVAAFLPIADRYNGIISDLGLTISLDREFEEITDNFTKRVGRDYAASRGEYLNARILARYLGYDFIDAAEVIFFMAACMVLILVPLCCKTASHSWYAFALMPIF
jgi:aspartate kinase